ncbi:MAG: V-type ATP synthase subunit I [Methanoregula sp.]|nr:V-type ATP synthase subunit I [Methanoregula sp.]
MLAPKRMSRLLIAASRDRMAPVVAELYRHHLFHIEEFVEAGAEGYEGFKIGTPLSGASEASVDLVKIRAIENATSIHGDDIDSAKTSTRTELRSRIERELPVLEQEVGDLTIRRSKLDARLKENEQKIVEITPFLTLPVYLDLYRGYSGFAVFAGYVAHEVALSVPCEMSFSPGKDKNFIVIVAPVGQRSEVERALQEANFQSVPVPEETGAPQARIDYYTSEISTMKTEIAEIHKKLDDVRKKHTGFLVACEEFLRAEVEQTEAPLRFATTKQTFVAEGWVPSENVEAITDGLVKATGGKIYVTVLPIDFEHDNIPVEYNNPSFAKPTQVLMDVYSRPKYTELDPTLMVSIVFPLFFGLILGDVGYGLILLAMALGLRQLFKGEEARQLLTVLRNASISTIIFGLLFSEFLGFAIPGLNPIMPSRHLMVEHGAHGPMIPDLMVLAIWIGVLHITIGRLLGIINHARQDHGEHRTKAMMANFGWIAVMWGILIAIWSIAPLPLMPNLTGLAPLVSIVNVGVVFGAVLAFVGLLLIARDSVLEVVEIPTIISHVLSYTRIVAVGFSSVAIAMVVNFISIGMFIQPQLENFSIFSIFIIIAGLVVFLLGHALNTVLGILGGGLHSIRLHYVEFFTKFYKGGGVKYVPFGMKRRFTED